MKIASVVCVAILFAPIIAAPQVRAAATAPTLKIVYSFDGFANGAQPLTGLVKGPDGCFYGTTSYGGATQAAQGGLKHGTVFKVTPLGKITTLHKFMGKEGANKDGSFPDSDLVLGRDGYFYGTTTLGGAYDKGIVFKMKPSGALVILHSFTGVADGGIGCGLIQGRDGNFYGTTSGNTSVGGKAHGTVFKITPKGVYTLLHMFNDASGNHPVSSVTEGRDGNFYGTASGNGKPTDIVFKMTPKGAITTLYTFSKATSGMGPRGALTQTSDGSFWGSTYYGGEKNQGVIFKITPTGKMTLIYSFNNGKISDVGPRAQLIQGSDGNFYGTTEYGGDKGAGTVYKITPSGKLTILHSFSGKNGDGAYPWGDLLRGGDGSFYGTTPLGGATNDGTVFKINIPGVK